MHIMFITAQFTRAKSWKQLVRPPTDGWLKKMWYLYTMEHYSAIKKDRREPSTGRKTDVPGDHSVQQNKSDSQAEIFHSFSYMRNQKHKEGAE